MTLEELQELKEKAELWDSLGDTLLKLFSPRSISFKPVIGKMDCELTKEGFLKVKSTSTIENISNASTHIDVLKQEFSEGLCSCGNKKFGHFSRCQSCLDNYTGHSGNGNF